jgi:hypothetical protein
MATGLGHLRIDLSACHRARGRRTAGCLQEEVFLCLTMCSRSCSAVVAPAERLLQHRKTSADVLLGISCARGQELPELLRLAVFDACLWA